MARILCIETSTKVCSIGLSVDGEITDLREDLSNRYSHAEKINVFIDEVTGPDKFLNLDAVAVSEGPGSYTGLRIGVSTAKGICFGQNLPLISVNPLEAMARQIEGHTKALRIAMIDARRLEVFCAGFDAQRKQIFKTRAEILSENSFDEYLDFDEVICFGDGAEKAKEILKAYRFKFVDVYASAKGMAGMALEKFIQGDFEDLAYFEPYYLKDFVAGKSKKGLR